MHQNYRKQNMHHQPAQMSHYYFAIVGHLHLPFNTILFFPNCLLISPLAKPYERLASSNQMRLVRSSQKQHYKKQ